MFGYLHVLGDRWMFSASYLSALMQLTDGAMYGAK